MFRVKPKRAVGNTSLSTNNIRATNPPIDINPFSNWYVPKLNRINNEIEDIPCSKGNNVLAVLASFIAELRYMSLNILNSLKLSLRNIWTTREKKNFWLKKTFQ